MVSSTLLFSLGLICLFARARKTDYLLPISLKLHSISLLGASYTMFVNVPFPHRDALFFLTIESAAVGL